MIQDGKRICVKDKAIRQAIFLRGNFEKQKPFPSNSLDCFVREKERGEKIKEEVGSDLFILQVDPSVMIYFCVSYINLPVSYNCNPFDQFLFGGK